MGISVAICCYQAAGRIEAVLDGLLAQQRPSCPWELVIVDNSCNDATIGLARQRWGDEKVPLRPMEEPRLGVGFAREAALHACRYELLAFLDDDNVPAENWLLSIERHFASHPDSGAVSGYSQLHSQAAPPAWFSQVAHSWAVGAQAAQDGEVASLWGAGLVVRRSVWLDLLAAGFRPRCVGRQGLTASAGEDSELVAAISLAGWKLRYDSRLRITHRLPDSRLTLSYARKLYAGFGEASVWMDAYWRAGQRCYFWHRDWRTQALFGALALAWVTVRLAISANRPRQLLDQALLWARLKALLRHRFEFNQAHREIEEAPWRVRLPRGN